MAQSVAQAQNRYAALVGSPRYRFPAGATEWSIANAYILNSIVYVLDPYQTEFFQPLLWHVPAPVHHKDVLASITLHTGHLTH
jgi:hypothetical protein